jgi:hypothetical protein
MLRIKDILPILPKHSDNSGYDVQIGWARNEKEQGNRYPWWTTALLSSMLDQENKRLGNDINFLDWEIKEITSGVACFGGEYDNTLHVWVTGIHDLYM